jgi:hypothetical protein
MSADIDIDFADRDLVLKLIRHTPARQVTQGQVRRHNSGVYVTDIPHDPINGCAAIDYEQAEQRGYFKLDFLNMSVYQLVKSPEHYQEMLAATPPWNRLWQDTNWSKQLVHVGNYTDLLNQLYHRWQRLSVSLDQAKLTCRISSGRMCLLQYGTATTHKDTRLKSHML